MFLETKDLFGKYPSGRPYLNVPNIGTYSYASSTLIADKKTIMLHVKKSPEALGIVRAIAMDIITSLEFRSIIKPGKGRPSQDTHKNAEDKARKFSKVHQVKQTLMADVMDWLITGDSYTWKGEDLDRGVREIVYNKLKEFGIEVKEIDYKQFLDEDPEEMKQLVYVPSTTVSIKMNSEGTGIETFKQETYSNRREWKPNEIIHAKFMDLDGKIHGYTPMEASIPLLKTLGLITDYHGHFFDSGGTPDIIFNFKTMGANDPGLAKWQQIIDEWANNKRRGHLVIGSELDVVKVNEMNKDMEFRLLAIYYTGRLAFSFGMPLEKFQAILGSEVKSSTGSSDLGNADYQRNIAAAQDYWENLFNTQFWNENFNVDMILVRGFLQDQVRQLQVDTQKVAKVQGIIQMGIIKNENIPDFISFNFPEIPRDWIETNPPRDWVSIGMPNLPNDKVQKGQGRQAFAQDKKNQQKPQQDNNPPSGS